MSQGWSKVLQAHVGDLDGDVGGAWLPPREGVRHDLALLAHGGEADGTGPCACMSVSASSGVVVPESF